MHTGTIPSKTLRETVLNLTGWREHGFYGRAYRVKKDIDAKDLMTRLHIVGEGATELVHIGQAVLNLQGTLDYFIENTFNYPTLAEAYKIAALDARNRMPIG